MATPMFRDLSRAFGAPTEGLELASGLYEEDEPAYTEEMFSKASEAALAREAMKPKEGYVPPLAGPAVEPSLDSTLAPMPSGIRSRKPAEFVPETAKLQGKLAGSLRGIQFLRDPAAYARPLSDEELAAETARAQKLMAEDDAQYAAKTPAIAPVPTAAGPSPTAAAPSATVTKTMTMPPPPPAARVAGAGGDVDLDRLALGQSLIQGLETFGSAVSGKNLRSGMAESLGERLKQVQALRAKRAEREEDVTREQAQYEGANLATLTTNLASFKDRPDIVAALENMRAGAKYTKPSDFLKGVYQAVTNPPKVEGLAADVKLKGAKKDTEVAKGAEVGPEGISKRGLRSSQEALNRARIDALKKKSVADALALTKSKAAVAGAKTPAEAARFLRDDIKTAEKAISPTLENFKNIEAAAPGFIFGDVPEWLTQTSLVAAEKSPLLAAKAAPLRAALENLIIDIRHGSFGASLTASEKASFETLLNTSLTGSAAQLANVLAQIRRKAASIAQTHFATTQNLYPEESSKVLSSSAVFGPAVAKGGIYSDVWQLSKAGPAAAGEAPATKRKPQPTNTTAMRNESGVLKYVPNDQVSAAEAAGWKRE